MPKLLSVTEMYYKYSEDIASVTDFRISSTHHWWRPSLVLHWNAWREFIEVWTSEYNACIMSQKASEVAAFGGWAVCVEILLPITNPLEKYANLSIPQMLKQEANARQHEALMAVAYWENKYAYALRCYC